jgi:hypothetical protein
MAQPTTPPPMMTTLTRSIEKENATVTCANGPRRTF